MTHIIKNWNDLVLSTDAQIMEWAGRQPWVAPMAECMQDPTWHAEGDVWTHTKMVVDELFKLDDWATLSRDDQLKLLLTALLHDSGKPATTLKNPETGRIRSPKHSQVGMRIARRQLIDLECDVKTRESICGLIRYHGWPPYLPNSKKPARDLIKLSAFVDHRLLYRFALADWRGRTTLGEKRGDDQTLELWPMVAEENHCLDQPYSFANDHARVLFHRGNLDNLHYAPHEDYRCRMTVMCGLPGAGKDTWLGKHRPDTPVVSLDEFRKTMKVSPTDNQGEVVQAAKNRCRELLRSKTDFALNATNTTGQIRQLWIDLGFDYDARIEIVYLEPSIKVLIEQNQGRDARVPIKVIQRLIDKLDPPTLAECHELVMG